MNRTILDINKNLIKSEINPVTKPKVAEDIPEYKYRQFDIAKILESLNLDNDQLNPKAIIEFIEKNNLKEMLEKGNKDKIKAGLLSRDDNFINYADHDEDEETALIVYNSFKEMISNIKFMQNNIFNTAFQHLLDKVANHEEFNADDLTTNDLSICQYLFQTNSNNDILRDIQTKCSKENIACRSTQLCKECKLRLVKKINSIESIHEKNYIVSNAVQKISLDALEKIISGIFDDNNFPTNYSKWNMLSIVLKNMYFWYKLQSMPDETRGLICSLSQYKFFLAEFIQHTLYCSEGLLEYVNSYSQIIESDFSLEQDIYDNVIKGIKDSSDDHLKFFRRVMAAPEIAALLGNTFMLNSTGSIPSDNELNSAVNNYEIHAEINALSLATNIGFLKNQDHINSTSDEILREPYHIAYNLFQPLRYIRGIIRNPLITNIYRRIRLRTNPHHLVRSMLRKRFGNLAFIKSIKNRGNSRTKIEKHTFETIKNDITTFQEILKKYGIIEDDFSNITDIDLVNITPNEDYTEYKTHLNEFNFFETILEKCVDKGIFTKGLQGFSINEKKYKYLFTNTHYYLFAENTEQEVDLGTSDRYLDVSNIVEIYKLYITLANLGNNHNLEQLKKQELLSIIIRNNQILEISDFISKIKMVTSDDEYTFIADFIKDFFSNSSCCDAELILEQEYNHPLFAPLLSLVDNLQDCNLNETCNKLTNSFKNISTQHQNTFLEILTEVLKHTENPLKAKFMEKLSEHLIGDKVEKSTLPALSVNLFDNMQKDNDEDIDSIYFLEQALYYQYKSFRMFLFENYEPKIDNKEIIDKLEQNICDYQNSNLSDENEEEYMNKSWQYLLYMKHVTDMKENSSKALRQVVSEMLDENIDIINENILIDFFQKKASHIESDKDLEDYFRYILIFSSTNRDPLPLKTVLKFLTQQIHNKDLDILNAISMIVKHYTKIQSNRGKKPIYHSNIPMNIAAIYEELSIINSDKYSYKKCINKLLKNVINDNIDCTKSYYSKILTIIIDKEKNADEKTISEYFINHDILKNKDKELNPSIALKCMVGIIQSDSYHSNMYTQLLRKLLTSISGKQIEVEIYNNLEHILEILNSHLAPTNLKIDTFVNTWHLIREIKYIAGSDIIENSIIQYIDNIKIADDENNIWFKEIYDSRKYEINYEFILEKINEYNILSKEDSFKKLVSIISNDELIINFLVDSNTQPDLYQIIKTILESNHKTPSIFLSNLNIDIFFEKLQSDTELSHEEKIKYFELLIKNIILNSDEISEQSTFTDNVSHLIKTILNANLYTGTKNINNAEIILSVLLDTKINVNSWKSILTFIIQFKIYSKENSHSENKINDIINTITTDYLSKTLEQTELLMINENDNRETILNNFDIFLSFIDMISVINYTTNSELEKRTILNIIEILLTNKDKYLDQSVESTLFTLYFMYSTNCEINNECYIDARQLDINTRKGLINSYESILKILLKKKDIQSINNLNDFIKEMNLHEFPNELPNKLDDGVNYSHEERFYYSSVQNLTTSSILKEFINYPVIYLENMLDSISNEFMASIQTAGIMRWNLEQLESFIEKLDNTDSLFIIEISSRVSYKQILSKIHEILKRMIKNNEKKYIPRMLKLIAKISNIYCLEEDNVQINNIFTDLIENNQEYYIDELLVMSYQDLRFDDNYIAEELLALISGEKPQLRHQSKIYKDIKNSTFSAIERFKSALEAAYKIKSKYLTKAINTIMAIKSDNINIKLKTINSMTDDQIVKQIILSTINRLISQSEGNDELQTLEILQSNFNNNGNINDIMGSNHETMKSILNHILNDIKSYYDANVIRINSKSIEIDNLYRTMCKGYQLSKNLSFDIQDAFQFIRTIDLNSSFMKTVKITICDDNMNTDDVLNRLARAILNNLLTEEPVLTIEQILELSNKLPKVFSFIDNMNINLSSNNPSLNLNQRLKKIFTKSLLNEVYVHRELITKYKAGNINEKIVSYKLTETCFTHYSNNYIQDYDELDEMFKQLDMTITTKVNNLNKRRLTTTQRIPFIIRDKSKNITIAFDRIKIKEIFKKTKEDILKEQPNSEKLLKLISSLLYIISYANSQQLLNLTSIYKEPISHDHKRKKDSTDDMFDIDSKILIKYLNNNKILYSRLVIDSNKNRLRVFDSDVEQQIGVLCEIISKLTNNTNQQNVKKIKRNP